MTAIKENELSAMRRAIKVLEVILKAMNREIKWIQAADILGVMAADLVRIFAIRHEDRTVANDNMVRVNNLTLQIEPSRFRHHFAKCRLDVLKNLDGTYAVIWKNRGIGRYDVQGQILRINPGGQPPDPRSWVGILQSPHRFPGRLCT